MPQNGQSVVAISASVSIGMHVVQQRFEVCVYDHSIPHVCNTSNVAHSC